jgi:hypothetical protein
MHVRRATQEWVADEGARVWCAFVRGAYAVDVVVWCLKVELARSIKNSVMGHYADWVHSSSLGDLKHGQYTNISPILHGKNIDCIHN